MATKVETLKAKLAGVKKSLEENDAERAKVGSPFFKKMDVLHAALDRALAPVVSANERLKKNEEELRTELELAEKAETAALFETRAPATFDEFKKWFNAVGQDVVKKLGEKVESFWFKPLACRETVPGCSVLAAAEDCYRAGNVYCVFKGAKLVAVAVVHPSRHAGDSTDASAVVNGKEVVFETGYKGVSKPVNQFFGAVRARLS